ncbi:MAG: hypothetical protein E6767_02635 [Dysgonomonas sp.]|nr:hypothetical protein [Dysgonomonas sp.]
MKNFNIRKLYTILICIFVLLPTNNLKAYDDWDYWDDFSYDSWDDFWDDYWDNYYNDDYYDDGSWYFWSDNFFPDDNNWDDYDEDWTWDDYDDPPSNSNNDNDSHEDTETAQKQKVLDDIVKNLERKTGIKAQEVRIDNIKSMALYNSKTGEIVVGELWFLKSKDDQMSILYHEYTHSKQDKHVGRTETGEFIMIKTDQPINWTAREIEIFKQICKDEDLDPAIATTVERICLESFINQDYTYMPSNYQWNEINAYQSQLDGEANGWWTFTDTEREEYQNRLDQYKASYERALEYEKKNGLNPDGTKK